MTLSYIPSLRSALIAPCLLISFIFLTAAPSDAQWSQQSSGSSEMLRGVHMVDNSTGWAVGDAGEVLYTSNGGSSWNAQSSGTSAPLLDASASDPSTAWTVGGFPTFGVMNGTILYTTNGGGAWNSVSSGEPYVFTSVHFVDASEGWLVGGGGGKILHSTNGGTSWNDQSTGSDSLSSVFFSIPSIGWIAGENGTVLSTGSGGSSWSTIATGTSEDLSSIHFPSLSTGWTVGTNGTILKTTNGGAAWSPQSAPVSVDLYDVHFVDVNTGWAVGDNGTVLHTDDGGSTWVMESSSTSEDLRAVHFPVDSLGWAVGDNGEIIVRSGSGCQSSSSSISPSACLSYTVPSGDETYTTGGTYSDTILNSMGCDSIISIDLTIDTVDTAVSTVSAMELEAQANNASYQWLNCDSGYAVINGATSQNFTASSGGSYAVEVTQNGCTDTSSCHSVQDVGLQENQFEDVVEVRPNPTGGTLMIEPGKRYKGLQVRALDLSGRTLKVDRYGNSSRVRFELEGDPGLYLIEVEDARGRKATFKVLKE